MRASDRAYGTLRDEIIDGTLPSGTVLAEVEQSTRLGVSRTPLREALGRLQADGLVGVHSGRGLEVTEISDERIIELFEVRQPLEQQTARLAAERRDPAVFEALRAEFTATDSANVEAYFELVARLDRSIDLAAGNALLTSTLDGVRTHVARIRRRASENPQRLRETVHEHLAIIDAILEGDASLAAHAVHLHLHRSLANIRLT